MKLSKILLLGLGFMEDYLESYHESIRFFNELSGAWVPRQYKYAIKVMEKKKLIEDGERGLLITELGRDYLSKEFPLLEWRKKPWDKKWRIVMYDFPEKVRFKRDILRE